MGWKENKETVSPRAEIDSDSSSGHHDIAGKKTSEEGVIVGTTTREVR